MHEERHTRPGSVSPKDRIPPTPKILCQIPFCDQCIQLRHPQVAGTQTLPQTDDVLGFEEPCRMDTLQMLLQPLLRRLASLPGFSEVASIFARSSSATKTHHSFCVGLLPFFVYVLALRRFAIIVHSIHPQEQFHRPSIVITQHHSVRKLLPAGGHTAAD